MANLDRAGQDWSDNELDAIVADYFDMLDAELTGRRYVKAHHCAALMKQLGRSHRSVEFKHMNISAVLGALGRPTIRGYRPMPNVQSAIFEAIDRYLSRKAEPPYVSSPDLRALARTPIGFDPAPPLEDAIAKQPGMARLLRKFDPAARDARNRSLGEAGEALIIDFERERLARAERSDLAAKVRWVSQEDGDGAGYDILSFDAAGAERFIEVKTTEGAQTTPFFLTRNEHALSLERPDVFRLYRLYRFSQAPRIFELAPPLEDWVTLRPETYRAEFS
jgi:hypothetical protein